MSRKVEWQDFAGSLACVVAWCAIVIYAIDSLRHPVSSAIGISVAVSWLVLKTSTFSIIDLTHGWLVNWETNDGRFKGWVRGLELTSINHGWWYSLSREPGLWWDSLCHLISWAPILFKDKDWDHAYLLLMMHEKLKRMRIYQEKYGNSTTHLEIAKQIRVAEELIKRIMDDDYCMEELLEHHDKYEVGKRWASRTKTEDGKYYPVPSASEEESKASSRIYDKQEALRKQDLEYFGKWFARHVRNWWD